MLTMIIREIESFQLHLPVDPTIAPHLHRSSHPRKLAVYRVLLDNDIVGYGEQVGPPDDVSELVGHNAVTCLRETTRGGVQMACYDAVGKALGVPAHALMGRQTHDRIPYAYWSIDTPSETLAGLAKGAAEQGYRVYKYKCRPWWDPVEQMESVAKVVPNGFSFWLDFNGHLREVSQALPILKELQRFGCVAGFESPIPQRDAAGYATLRNEIDRPIAAHYGTGCCHVTSDPFYDPGTPAQVQIRERLCDAFVLGGRDVEMLRRRASAAAEADMPFWIQTVGSGLSAAWVVQLASTCPEGSLSHLAAHNVWQRDIVALPEPEAGWTTVPDGHGLGVTVDDEALELFSRSKPAGQPRRISTVVYPDGRRWHFATEQQRHEAFYFGRLPGFMRGIRLETREDDQSRDFAGLYARCSATPVPDQA